MADEHKAVPVSASSLIPVGGKNFASMRSVNDLKSLEASAPAFHGQVLNSLKAGGKVREETGEALSSGMTRQPRMQMQQKTFTRGTLVKDTATGKKGTIIQASAGFTRKTGQPVHKIADKDGDVWLAKQKNLVVIL